MSKVLTWEEYDALEKGKKESPISHIEEKKPVEEIPTPAESSTEYCLMFPDNPVDNYHNGFFHVDEVNIVEIINGVVKTDSKEISDKLVKQGFLFLQSKEKTDEQ